MITGGEGKRGGVLDLGVVMVVVMGRMSDGSGERGYRALKLDDDNGRRRQKKRGVGPWSGDGGGGGGAE